VTEAGVGGRDASDEASLVRRCAAGDDPDAWRELVDRYGPLLKALARRMLGRRTGRADDADVDEVAAEVFLALLRQERRLLVRYDPAWRLATYLGVVCRTEVLRLLRRRGRSPGPLPRETAAEAVGAAADERLRARVREALDGLGGRDALLLRLRFLDGLDYRAIAEALDLSPESVGPLLARAKRRLLERAARLEDLLAEDG